MKKKRYSEKQIIKAIKDNEAGAKVDDICRDLSISTGTFYNWRSKYAGLEVNEPNGYGNWKPRMPSSRNYWLRKCWRMMLSRM